MVRIFSKNGPVLPQMTLLNFVIIDHRHIILVVSFGHFLILKTKNKFKSDSSILEKKNKFHEKVCSASFSQKRIGIDPFFVWDPGLLGIVALGIGIGNRKSNLKNLESGIENRTLENRESESKIESGSKTLVANLIECNQRTEHKNQTGEQISQFHIAILWLPRTMDEVNLLAS